MLASWRVGVLVWLAIAPGIGPPVEAQQKPAPIVNPPGVRLQLELTDPGPFREMQMIRGTIELQRPTAKAGDAEFVWTHGGYLVDPPLGDGSHRCGIPQRPCLRVLDFVVTEGHFWGGGLEPAKTPLPIRITERLPALPPGNYRIAATAIRQEIHHHGSTGNPATPQPPPTVWMAVSNWVPITVLPASEEWIQQTLSGGLPSPNPPADGDPSSHRAWLDQIHQLQLLDHPAAWEALAFLRRSGNPIDLKGLSSSRFPEQACSWLRNGLDDPQRLVDSWYFNTLTAVCGKAELPPAPMTVPGVPPHAELLAQLRAYSHRHRQWQIQHMERVAMRLLASLPRRQERSLSDALITLLELIPTAQQHVQSGQAAPSGTVQAGVAFAGSRWFFFGRHTASDTEPIWAPRFRQELPSLVAALDPVLRGPVLERVANHFESPDWAPVLEAELRQLGPADAWGSTRQLLYPLAALDPDRAANLIVSELRKPETWLSAEMLTLLPVDPTPFTDLELLEMLENHGATASDHSIWLATVARYASPEAAPRIREIFEQREPACQEALVGYFVRADPDYAASILGGNWNMRSVPPPCHFQYLQNAANYGMGPVLEKFLTAYLFHSHVPLKQAAAMSLQRHGSPAAQEALFAAMRHFHNYWKGREDELQQNSEGTSFQHVLVHSLTGASHWTLPAQRIQALRDLCIGAQCQQHTGHLIQTWQQPLNVNAIQSQGGFRGTLAQYSFNSREQMRTRIRQLPAGTHIRVSVAGADAEALRAVILGEAATAGLVVD